MLSEDFQNAASEVLRHAQERRTAYMCAERMWFQCHRMLVSDYFVAYGHTVLHIESEKEPKSHVLMKEARLIDGRLVYKGDHLFS